MITEGTMYWITRLDHIRDAAQDLCIISIVGAVILGISLFILCMDKDCEALDDGDFYKRVKHRLKLWLTIFLLGLLLATGIYCFVPSTKEMAMIKIILALANSQFVAEELPKDAQRIYKLGIRALEEKLEVKENK